MPFAGERGSRPRALAVLGGALALAACAVAAARPGSSVTPPTYAAVIPQPVEAAEGRGTFELTAATRIVAGAGGADVAGVGRYLAGLLRPATGFKLPVVAPARAAGRGAVALSLAAGRRDLGEEGYELSVAPQGVTLTARRAAGLFHGAQTLRQLLRPEIELDAKQPGPWQIRAGTIRDRPRFAWRGAMLDVARHFFGVADVKRYVDLLALYKLTRLHLHLADDQGWRISIRSWPKLTTVGGSSQVGGGPGGYYTQRQYAEIVEYARSRFITVVPEMDMPGHVNAALASYAKLNCDGVARPLYTGIEVGFSSLCVGKEITYRFVDDVVRELAGLTPGRYVHIGGDEAAATTPDEYVEFVRRAQAIVRAHGKRAVGWEEVAKAPVALTTLVQHWHSGDLARQAVRRGAKLLMSPATKAYLDMKYGRQSPIGLTWAGFTGVRDAYDWDPATQVEGVGEEDIVGVEAPLWSETVTTFDDIAFLAFPRLVGLAEIAWSPREGRTWQRFKTRLATHGPRLRALDVNYYAAPVVPWR